jgi:hypothetical protein
MIIPNIFSLRKPLKFLKKNIILKFVLKVRSRITPYLNQGGMGVGYGA